MSATAPTVAATEVGTQLSVTITRTAVVRGSNDAARAIQVAYRVNEGEHQSVTVGGIWSLAHTARLMLGRSLYDWGFSDRGSWLQRAAAEDLAEALVGRRALVTVGEPVLYADGVLYPTIAPGATQLYEPTPPLPAYRERLPKSLPSYHQRKDAITTEIVTTREWRDEEGELHEETEGEPEHRPTQRGNVYEALYEHATDRPAVEARLTEIYKTRGIRRWDDEKEEWLEVERCDLSNGLNFDDIDLLTGERLNSITPRLNELDDQGYARGTHAETLTSSGKTAQAYVCDEHTAKGYDVDCLRQSLRKYVAWKNLDDKHRALLVNSLLYPADGGRVFLKHGGNVLPALRA